VRADAFAIAVGRFPLDARLLWLSPSGDGGAAGLLTGRPITGTVRMIAAAQDEFEAKGRDNPGEGLEADPLSQAVFDHRPGRLTHAGSVTLGRLGGKLTGTGGFHFESEVDDDVFDRVRVLATAVRHGRISTSAARPALIDVSIPAYSQSPDGDGRRKSSRATLEFVRPHLVRPHLVRPHTTRPTTIATTA
jgi:hypothetical protein